MTNIQNYPHENNCFMIAAHARSGSTYLCKLLMNISSLKVYLEIFHFKIETIQLHLQGDYELVKEKLDLSSDPLKIRSKLIHDYQNYLKYLELINPDKLVAFKVFPKHLADQKLEGVIKKTRFIIILRRNLLHSYISNTIARELKTWRETNTSNNKVQFSPDEFLEHVKNVVTYYQNVKNIACKYAIDTVYVDYEDLIVSGNPLALLQTSFGKYLGELQNTKISEGVNISRQDKREYASQKIINQDDLMNFLEKHNLSILDDGTSSIDLDRYQKLLV